jgi:hypothetical protein
MDVSIDFAALAGARDELRRVIDEFDGTEEFSSAVADTVGHDGLAGTVRDFASSWNVRRRDLIEQLTMVRDYIAAVHDTFLELDERLAKGVDPAQASSAAQADLDAYYERRGQQ